AKNETILKVTLNKIAKRVDKYLRLAHSIKMKRGVAHLAKSSNRPKTAINIGVPMSLPRPNMNLVVNVADRHAVATDSTGQISLIIVLFIREFFL
ncbi:hypothetical protein UB37_19110, partial [Photobacterium iliopiscarium]